MSEYTLITDVTDVANDSKEITDVTSITDVTDVTDVTSITDESKNYIHNYIYKYNSERIENAINRDPIDENDSIGRILFIILNEIDLFMVSNLYKYLILKPNIFEIKNDKINYIYKKNILTFYKNTMSNYIFNFVSDNNSNTIVIDYEYIENQLNRHIEKLADS